MKTNKFYSESLVKNIPVPRLTLKGWWWKKFFRKYRIMNDIMNDMVDYYNKNGGALEFQNQLHRAIIEGTSFVQKPCNSNPTSKNS